MSWWVTNNVVFLGYTLGGNSGLLLRVVLVSYQSRWFS